MSLYGQDNDNFKSTMLLNVDQLQKQLDKDEFQEEGSTDRRVNKRQMQTQESKIDTGKAVDADFVDTESSGTESDVQDDSSRVDQYPEQCQVKSHMLDSSPDNQTIEYSKQSLESENILLKKTVAQFEKDFSRMEAHCIALELKYHNHALKSRQHGQILNEASNKAKMKKEIDSFETINNELKHSVAKLLKWQPTGKIIKTVDLRRIPTRKLLDSWTGKVDSELPHGSNVDISKIHACKQTLDLNAGLRVLRDSFAYKEYGIRLMLAPRSAKALHEKVLLKLHGIRKLYGSLSFDGTLF
uniref:Uncharacterized protein n=1 Tax=Tanacetum cinerariifolium TaxID=118510 RepID=A0A699I5W3_TANCI|nr:hypothetical protein [Tanacetum cinerariifolium]